MSPKQKQKIEINKSRGFAVGDFATIINNFWDEKILKKLGLEQRTGFILLAILVVGMALALFLALFLTLRPHHPETMSGDFRIAVAGFSQTNDMGEKVGYELADGVRLRLQQDLTELDPGLIVTVWGPDQVGTIKGEDAQSRAEQAEKLAGTLHADLVVYGLVEIIGGQMKVTPEFYISEENFYEISEITGQYEFGTPFALPGTSNSAWRYEFGIQMYSRSKALSLISVGLGYFALHNYDTALTMFQTAEQLENWDDAQGKKVIYAFVGFSAGKAGQYDVAELALKKAIELDPKYARPFIGMANLNYMRALLPFEKSKNPDDIDNALLENCFSYLDLAVQAPEKPPLAEVDTKIHFSRGQCLMLKAYARLIPSLEPAYNEFQLVIQAYGDGKNPRVRELAAESHARVGMIYRLTGQNEKAISEYQATVNLLYDYPERQKLYQESIEEITKDIPTP